MQTLRNRRGFSLEAISTQQQKGHVSRVWQPSYVEETETKV